MTYLTQKVTINKYFHFLVMVWAVVGIIMQIQFGKTTLFYTINTHHTPLLDKLMYPITFMGQPEVIVPCLFSLFIFKRFRNKWYFITALACNTIPVLIQQTLKNIFQHPRPLLYFNKAEWIHRLPEWPELFRNSFPSGHSQGAFSLFCFLSLILPKKYQSFGVAFFFCAAAVGYSRIYLSAHFFEDVYAGSLIGVVATTLIFAFLEKYHQLSTPLEEEY